ncbi:sensor histidine kinase [Siminovitchia sp. FSL H7-0308]|uniref:histidine kinase n=1 Tax=Siminovitchia thermophila TaxID=1245522 RepID=A0ABS2RAF8_9BACI|nr:sensor histidine kinase [Siminovitchia thermophila]MBM7716179.1 two-component system sensor histidine kinase DesK [Siminovitchia thermophila]ONK21473.1 two-component sensor histidine kinase [Bacillus sp. VT-16-64]
MSRTFEIFPKRYGFFPYIFLIYLMMPAYYISRTEGWKALLGWGLLLLFLITYRQLYIQLDTQKTFTFWLVVQIITMIFLTLWYSPYHLFLGFFSAHFIGWFKHKKEFYIGLIGLATALAIGVAISIVQGINTLYFLPFVAIMLVSPFGLRSMNKSMELEKQLDEANEQIRVLIKREERVRIARDLHDTLGHTLSLITLQSQLVQRLSEKDPIRAKAEAKEIEITSRSALRQVRELVSSMRAITIKEELADMQRIINAAGMQFIVKGEEDVADIPLLQQNILGMCLKEAGTNIVKHSKAKHCTVYIERGRGKITITVQDDGGGIDQQNMNGNGLSGMKERLSLIDGKLTIQSNAGTTVKMQVPIVMKQDEEGAVI